MSVEKKFKIRLSKEEVMVERRGKMAIGIIAILISIIVFAVYGNIILSGVSLAVTFVALFLTFRLITSLKKSARITKIEGVFPDFLQLVASNLRAGMTIDRAIFLSSRPEFAPLDEEILRTGKDISTGKPVELALKSMSDRIGSEKIEKTFLIIFSGICAGGNLAILLEETSRNMRQREFIEKKAASQVLMYIIFIFLAVSIFAPGLFSLSGILVETMTNLMGGISLESLPQNLPVSFSTINISVDFVFYFSIVFIIVMNIMASLVLGLVGKGNEKEGLRYLPIMLILSLSIFIVLGKILSGVIVSLTG
ncbi:MAG: type II secretion system F family protein [Nanoarchaeota archaeon]|nr:type II secretion system F family protein [Nanoarchaeota archaeon]